MDSARAPVDAGQPGLRLVRAVVGACGCARRPAVRAISVAEVVTPTATSAPWRATGGGAGPGRRHRHLQQRRQAPLRRPRRRLQPARRADRHRRTRRERVHRRGARRRDPAYAEELDRQLDATGTARVWVPAARAAGREWVPGADLRGVAGAAGARRRRRSCDARSRRWSTTSTTPRSSSSRTRPRELGTVRVSAPSRCSTAACPSFAVDPDGTLHTSLMRSCTGWPSGTWIDPPRRTAPDGSNFQLQHWTHTFDYARRRRRRRLARRRHPRAQCGVLPSAARRAGNAPAAGGLPRRSLLEVEPAGACAGRAQGRGQPDRRGQRRARGPRHGVALRLVETHGRDHRFVVRSGLSAVSPRRAPTCWSAAYGPAADGLTLHGYEIATMLTQLDAADPRRRQRGARAGSRSGATALRPVLAAQPGPRAAGRTARRRPPAPAPRAETGAQVRLRLTAASDCTDAALHGRVRLICPAGWNVDPASCHSCCPRGLPGHRRRR